MRTHKTGASLARRGLTALAGLAVVAGTLVGIAAPASAAISGASISPSTWAASEQAAATVTWTESANSSNTAAFNNSNPSTGGNYISVEVGWGWTLSGANPTATPVTYTATWDGTAKSYTCATIGTVFQSTGFSNTGSGAQCLVRRSSTDSSNPGQQVVLANIGGGSNFNFTGSASISVTFPAGKVTAPCAGPASDTWRITSLVTAQSTTVTTVVPGVDAAGNAVSLITLDFDANGGTCATAKMTGLSGSWGKAPEANDCTRSGYNFAGWNTSADGKGIWILPNGDINFTGDNRVYAQWVSPYQPINPPGLPTDVKATGKWNDVTVNWNAPADAGSLPITNYLVTATPSNKVCITSVVADKKPTQCTLHALVPGTSYTFKVQALNGGGWGSQSLASNAASPFNLKITKYDRKKGNLFQLFKSTVTVSGVTPGYAIGTTITPWIKVGNGEWTKLPNEAFKANSSGTFSWSKKFEKKLDSTPISVKFEDPQGNTSNSINTSEVGKLAPSVKINSARLNTSIIKPQITVIGTALNVPDDSRVTITFVQGAKKESVVIRLAKPGDFEARWRAVDPNIPTVVKASVGGVESNPIRVAKRG